MRDSYINYSRKIRMRGPLGEVELSTDYERKSFAASERSLDELTDAAIKAYRALEQESP